MNIGLKKVYVGIPKYCTFYFIFSQVLEDFFRKMGNETSNRGMVTVNRANDNILILIR